MTLTAVTFLVLATAPGLAAPGADVNQKLAEVRRATAAFHDVAAAEAAGFHAVSPCVAVPGLGGMGYHYLNHERLDMTLDELQPELLVYVPTGDGLRLAAVEYMLPALANTDDGPALWVEETPPPNGFATPRPTLFGGVPFDGPMPGHGPGEPWHYDLHVWVWKPNPDGVFTTWHPGITCA